MLLLCMRNFKLYERNQLLLMSIDLREWVADDDLAHFIVEAAERIEAVKVFCGGFEQIALESPA